MATSPQVAETVSSSAISAAGTDGHSVKSVLIFMLLGALIASLGFGGVLYYLAHSGRLSMRGAVVKASPPVITGTHLMALDPFLVNLADESGSSYLRLSMSLQVADNAAKKDAKPKMEINGDQTMVAVRDTALTVLGMQTSDDLLAPGGKERLKAALKSALAMHNADLKVKDLFFTDFLVQR